MQNKADVLFVSYGQKFGPAHVGVNLLQQLAIQRKISWLSVVDRDLATLLSKEIENKLIIARSFVHLFLVLLKCVLKGNARKWHFNFPPLKLMPILFLLKAVNTKIIYSFHGGILVEKKSLFAKGLFLFQCRYFFNTIIVNSDFSARLLLENDKKLLKKIVVIPNGVNLSYAIDCNNIDRMEGNPVILFVGRIEYVKGVDILVKAISLAKTYFPEICLHIVGQGKNFSEIVGLRSALSLQKHIKLHGLVSEAKKQQFYRSCDIIVVPSRLEPFGIVVLEAMLAHKPLIVSNLGALPELVKHGNNGYVVQLNPEEFSQAIVTLANNKALMSQMSENNRLTVENYNWQKIAQEYFNLYRASYTNRYMKC